MMPAKVSAVLPCVTFFSARRPLRGLVNLLMQVTLVFWPLSVYWAKQFQEERRVNGMLSQIAHAYPVPMQRAKPGKRFRGAVFADQNVFGETQRSLRRAA